MRITLIFLLLTLLAVPAAAQDTRPDFSDPVQVVEAIFEAARTGDPSILAELCPPDDANDGDTETLCRMTRESEHWEQFVALFSHGEVIGEAVIEMNRATVPFRFGPDGERQEEMRLALNDGRWYLISF